MPYISRNPASGEKLATFPDLPGGAVQARVDLAADGYRALAEAPLAARVRVLSALADLFEDRKQELAELATAEMGKPISQALGEVALSADIYRYYAENAEVLLSPQTFTSSLGGHATVALKPTGTVLGIMPWNFPYYQVARLAAPSILLGNSVLLKHAPNVPQAAIRQEELFRDAGAPDGAYVNLFASHEQLAQIVIPAPSITGVSLTGSERAGSAVATVAGQHLKKVVLELGGSDPFIVLGVADLDRTVDAAVTGRVQNAGQTCTASKRFIVLDDAYDDFVAALVEKMSALIPGDPALPATRLGPLATDHALEGVLAQVTEAVNDGAVLRTGGRRIPGVGAFMEPTVLTDVTPEMRAYTDEIFGPVAIVYRADDAAHAIEIANSSPYGLSGVVFSDDEQEAASVAARIESGMVFINSLSRTAPDLPFGGVKRSGVGRELGRYGIEEFANRKLVHRSVS